MQDNIDSINILNTNYTLIKKLSPDIFTERFLYINSNNNQNNNNINETNDIILVKEPNFLFEKLLSSNLEAMLLSFKEYRKINKLNLLKIEEIIIPQNVSTSLVATQFIKYNLFNLELHKNLSTFPEIHNNIVAYYAKQLIEILDYLDDKNVYYYTLRTEDVLIDSNFNLKLDEFAIGNAIIKNCKSNISFWVDKIFNKHGVLAPEFFFNQEFKMEGQGASVIFNLGYIFFILMIGRPPFTKLDDHYYKLIIDQKDEEFWNAFDNTNNLNKDFKELIFSMLSLNQFNRPMISKILENDWIRSSENISYSEVASVMKKIVDQIYQDQMSKSEPPVAKLSKPNKKTQNKVFRCVEHEHENKGTCMEILNKEINEFLEEGQKKFLIEYVDLNKYTSNKTVFFDNKFDEVVKYLANHFHEENYTPNFLLESITGIKFINSDRDESNKANEKVFEIRFYEEKVKKNYLAAEFVNISLDLVEFNKLFEDFLQLLNYQ